LATEIVRFVTVRLLSLGVCEISCLCRQTTKQFLSSRRRLDVLLAKLSRNYAEMSSRISSNEEKCASGVVGEICRLLCSTINRSVCTLYWNKNINTFWIDDAFYWKIKSCALIGTPYIIIRGILWVGQTLSPTSCVYYSRWKLFFKQCLCYRCLFHYQPEDCCFIAYEVCNSCDRCCVQVSEKQYAL